MDRGEQTLSMERVTAQSDGMYTAVKQIGGSQWEGTDPVQFCRVWRAQMALSGIEIDEEVFARTIRQVANDKARRFTYAVMRDIIDPVPDGQRLFQSTKTYPHHNRIKRAVRNLLSPRKCHKNQAAQHEGAKTEKETTI